MRSLVQRILVVTRRNVVSSTNVPWILTAVLLLNAAVSALLSIGISVRDVLHSERGDTYPLGSSPFQFQVSDDYNNLHKTATTSSLDALTTKSRASNATKIAFDSSEFISSESKYKHIREELDYTFHDRYTPQRIQWQDTVIDSLLRSGPPVNFSSSCRWIVFTAGAMGVGKSYTIQRLYELEVFPLPWFTLVDPDQIRQRLPEFAAWQQQSPYLAGERTRKEAGIMAEVLVRVALDRGDHVLVDGTLRDVEWYRYYFAQLRSRYANLKIAILHVVASKDSILMRVKVRPAAPMCLPVSCCCDLTQATLRTP
jgi:predicted kinase